MMATISTDIFASSVQIIARGASMERIAPNAYPMPISTHLFFASTQPSAVKASSLEWGAWPAGQPHTEAIPPALAAEPPFAPPAPPLIVTGAMDMITGSESAFLVGLASLAAQAACSTGVGA
jgi:hypothetical protein